MHSTTRCPIMLPSASICRSSSRLRRVRSDELGTPAGEGSFLIFAKQFDEGYPVILWQGASDRRNVAQRACKPSICITNLKNSWSGQKPATDCCVWVGTRSVADQEALLRPH